jgi:predicted kinase
MRRASRQAREDAEALEASLRPLPASEEVPAFIILSGLPGSGKSHFAQELSNRYPLAVLQIDVLRKLLFPRPVYSRQEHTRTFAAVHVLIDRLLSRKLSVLYDATNLKEQHRRDLYAIGDANGARLRIIRIHSPDQVALSRLSERSTTGEQAWSSDADEQVYETMRLEAEPIERSYIEVDTSKGIKEAVDNIVRDLERTRK